MTDFMKRRDLLKTFLVAPFLASKEAGRGETLTRMFVSNKEGVAGWWYMSDGEKWRYQWVPIDKNGKLGEPIKYYVLR